METKDNQRMEKGNKVDKKPGAKFKRIDPVDAVVDSHALMLLNKTEPVNIENELETYFRIMGWS